MRSSVPKDWNPQQMIQQHLDPSQPPASMHRLNQSFSSTTIGQGGGRPPPMVPGMSTPPNLPRPVWNSDAATSYPTHMKQHDESGLMSDLLPMMMATRPDHHEVPSISNSILGTFNAFSSKPAMAHHHQPADHPQQHASPILRDHSFEPVTQQQHPSAPQPVTANEASGLRSSLSFLQNNNGFSSSSSPHPLPFASNPNESQGQPTTGLLGQPTTGSAGPAAGRFQLKLSLPSFRYEKSASDNQPASDGSHMTFDPSSAHAKASITVESQDAMMYQSRPLSAIYESEDVPESPAVSQVFHRGNPPVHVSLSPSLNQGQHNLQEEPSLGQVEPSPPSDQFEISPACDNSTLVYEEEIAKHVEPQVLLSSFPSPSAPAVEISVTLSVTSEGHEVTSEVHDDPASVIPASVRPGSGYHSKHVPEPSNEMALHSKNPPLAPAPETPPKPEPAPTYSAPAAAPAASHLQLHLQGEVSFVSESHMSKEDSCTSRDSQGKALSEEKSRLSLQEEPSSNQSIQPQLGRTSILGLGRSSLNAGSPNTSIKSRDASIKRTSNTSPNKNYSTPISKTTTSPAGSASSRNTRLSSGGGSALLATGSSRSPSDAGGSERQLLKRISFKSSLDTGLKPRGRASETSGGLLSGVNSPSPPAISKLPSLVDKKPLGSPVRVFEDSRSFRKPSLDTGAVRRPA